MRTKECLISWLGSPWLALLNTLLCATALVVNAHYQFYCRPVTWAWLVAAITLLPVIVYPLSRKQLERIQGPIFILFGMAACVCLYCILFLGMMNWWIPFIMWIKPIAVLGYLPHFLLAQILFHTFAMRVNRPVRQAFAVGVTTCVVFAVLMAVWFDRSYTAVQAAIDDPPAHASKLNASYMTERMLGMHFKYHMSFCMWDGWRPPIHDPAIVVAAWLNSPFIDTEAAKGFKWSFLNMSAAPFKDHMAEDDLERRIAAYKVVFPHHPIRQECSCAKEYGRMYMNDPLLN